jgi:hypothetical protein
MTRINLIRRIEGPGRTEPVQRSDGKIIRRTVLPPYSWLVYRMSVVFVTGVGRLASYRQEIPFTFKRPGDRPKLRRSA